MIAIIESGGKQYMVSKGDKIQVEKLVAEKDAKLTFDRVLATFDGAKYQLGKPYLDGASVEAKVLKQGRAKKILIFKYKAKSKYRRTQGHRQSYTEVEITKV
jgi:large subunit ribosomal protein L21